MIVVDSSALVAIHFNEPEEDYFAEIIDSDNEVIISAANFVEAGMVIEGKYGIGGATDLDTLISELKIVIVPFTPEQAEIARKAFRTYGKGRHPAKLNICDCYAYALAKYYDAPLLFKGSDFSQTDIKIAKI
ncbi:MAG: type II toxin-antitoxin system VapC family toxin [Rickettsiales bacterium]